MINNLSELDIKVMNIEIARQLKKIDTLKKVITKPARKAELNKLYIDCLKTFININLYGY